MLNLDTHILLHAFNAGLTAREKKLLSAHQWSISAIVLWELCKLWQLKRINLDPKSKEFRKAMEGIHIWPLTLDVAEKSTKLDIKSDPADEMIAATSIVEEVPLLTRDKRLLQSVIVPFAR